MSRARQLWTWAALASAFTFGCYEDNEIEPPEADAQVQCTGDEVCGEGDCVGTRTCTDGVLAAECTYPEEICDGRDNDCDGETDEGFDDLGDACTDGQGACEDKGTYVCTADGSGTECNALPGDGGDELCNGIDDDCDGNTDEETGGDACDTGLPGVCGEGTSACAEGDTVCEPNTAASDEVCDGLDNDCDGNVDEGANGGPLAQPCYDGPEGTDGQGQCAAGVQVCTDGAFGECAEQVLPGEEICDTVDNDCDGEVDNVADGECVCTPGDVQGCYTGPEGTAGVGNCTEGVQTCLEDGSAWGACESEVVPGVELCDGLDNDCNGEVDDAAGVGGPCGEGLGACAAEGTLACDVGTGQVVCDAEPGLPADEVCDGQDNDCDGQVDNVPGAGEACRVGEGACAAAGIIACDEGGELSCDAVAGDPQPELCNGIDDDCNGEVDDVAGLGEDCEVGVGACRSTGFTVCGPEGVICGAVPQDPRPEICGNDIDEDCSGALDDDLECGIDCEVNEDCPDGAFCLEGQCAPIECTTDEECPQDDGPQICEGFLCQPGECRLDADCGEGELCVDNFCAPIPQGCIDTPTIADFGRRTGTTVGAPDEIGASCAGGAQEPERSWLLDLAYTGPVCLTTDGSRYDTALYVQTVCGQPGSEIACDDDGGEGVRSEIELDFTEGESVYVFVDGFAEGEGGPFILDVLEGPCTCRGDDDCPGEEPVEGEPPPPSASCLNGVCAPAECGNGVVESGEQCDDGGLEDGDGCAADCQEEPEWNCTEGPGACAPGLPLLGGAYAGEPSPLPPTGGEGGEPFADLCDDGEVVEALDLHIGSEWAGEANGEFIQRVRARCASVNVEGGRLYMQSAGTTPDRGDQNTPEQYNAELACPLGMAMTGYVGYTAERPDREGRPYLAGLAAVCSRITAGPDGFEFSPALVTDPVGRTDTEVGRFDCEPGQLVGGIAGGAAIIPDAVTMLCADFAPSCEQPSTCEFEGDCMLDEECEAGQICVDALCVDGDCRADEDCDAGQLCLDNNCTIADCRVNEDCAEGFICDGGFCQPEPEMGDIRLVDGTQISGRIEVYAMGQWGTVCDDAFGLVDGDVACRQLGFPGAAEVDIGGPGGPADQPIWLDQVECNGDEPRLIDCPANDLGDEDCSHTEDVAIRCLAPGECRDDSHCDAGESCVEGACQPLGCVVDEDCGPGALCEGDACIAGDCRLDEDCEEGQLCLGNLCTPADCRADEDCAEGELCLDNTCAPADCRDNGDCGDLELCVDNTCTPVEPTSCDNAPPLEFGELRGNTQGAPSTNDVASCAFGGPDNATGGDFTYSFTVDAPTTVCFDTFGSEYDTLIYVRADDCVNAENEVACNDDAPNPNGNGNTLQGRVELEAEPGVNYFTFVDGWRGAAGPFVLNVTEGPCGACEGDGDCRTGELCFGGACTTADCRVDGDCELGELCLDTQCVAGDCREDLDCGPDATCLDNTCTPFECELDEECGEGEICTDRFCVDGCRADEQCVDGELCIDDVCIPANCREDADCQDGEVCDANNCVVGNCVESADCAEGEFCDQNTCAPRPEDGAVRLADGEAENIGRVEIFFPEAWGTVCDDSFGIEDADVVCRQLGYPGAVRAIQNFGGGVDPIWLDEVGCVGDEESLADCPANELGVNNCGHFEDVGVECALGCETDEDCGEGEACAEGECVPSLCGNGADDIGEGCDDGNRDSGDGCDNRCQVEAGWECFGGPDDVPAAIDAQANCGNPAANPVAVELPPWPGGWAAAYASGGATFAGGAPRWSGAFEVITETADGPVRTNGQFAEAPSLEEVPNVFGDYVLFPPMGAHAVAYPDGNCGDNNGTIDVAFRALDVCRPVPCEADEQCIFAGELCIEGDCIEADCRENADCADGEVCDANTCVPGDCVANEDCAEGEICDANTCAPVPEPGTVRLADGEGENIGRVEIYFPDAWGTVCDDAFGLEDADVVCRQLGYPGALRAIQRFGGGVDPIWLDQVECVGDEQSLADCPANELGDNDCGHAEDVGVECALPCGGDEDCPDGQACGEGQCVPATCGNGTRDPGESCDDGNRDSGDGCDNRCQVEDGFDCFNGPADIEFEIDGLANCGVPPANPVPLEVSAWPAYALYYVSGAVRFLADETYNANGAVWVDGAGIALPTTDEGGNVGSVEEAEATYPGIRTPDFAVGPESVVFGGFPDAGCDDNEGTMVAEIRSHDICRPEVCVEDADCVFGDEICVDGACIVGDCIEDADCGDAEICLDNACTPGDCRINEDCADGEICDRNFCAPLPEDGDIRLIDGENEYSGRVEVFLQGEWGTVCDDNWEAFAPDQNVAQANADVACQQLGYVGAAAIDIDVPDGVDPTWLDDVACTGDEARLVDCPASPIGIDNCGHSEDVGIECILTCEGDADCPEGMACGDGECVPATCGDGEVGPGEQCDDGGRAGGDGCSNRCQIEDGFTCREEGENGPSICRADACEADEDCFGDEICLDNLCVVGNCREDVDCNDGETCVDNTCVAPEVCDDGIDNDNDGQIDCVDGDCAGTPECPACPEAEDGNEPNDDRDNATPLAPGLTEGLARCGNDDFYVFELCAGGTATLDALFIDALGDLDLAFQNAEGNVLDSSTSVSDNEQVTYTNEGEDPVTIYARAYFGDNPDYDLQLTLDGCGCPIDGEPNNDIASATAAQPGTYQCGVIEDAADTDYSSYDVPAGCTLTATLSEFEGDHDVYIYDADGNTLDRGFTLQPVETAEATPDADATLFVRADGAGGAVGPYTLDVAVVCPEAEICDDGIDNDLNGDIDCADAACVDAPNCQEAGACDDGIDNDADGLTDCADVDDCGAEAACQEAGNCGDGIDNDANGLLDCSDPACVATPECAGDAHGQCLFDLAVAAPFGSAGDAPWFVDGDAYSSGAIGSNQVSDLGVLKSLPTGGTIRFEYRVSSEPNFDYLQLLIDGQLADQWSGEVDWTAYEIADLPPGDYAFLWRYVKDGSADRGEDRGLVRNIEFVADECPPPPCAIDIEPNNDIASATPADPGTYDCGVIADAADTDYSSYAVDAGCELTATLSGFEGDHDLFLYDAEGNELARGFTLNPVETASATPAEATTLYVRADGAGGAVGGYTLDVAIVCPEAEICDDGIDNDLNGDIDCADAACADAPNCQEAGNCQDGIDNDADGLTDCADVDDCGAEPACVEVCDDGVDNDANGQLDCADQACVGDPACAGDAHGLCAFDLAVAAPFGSAGDAFWFVDGEALSSGDINDSQVSQLSLFKSLPTGGTIRFEYRVSSEQNFDYLQFVINGELADRWSGEVDWTVVEIADLPPGDYGFLWQFTKDGSASSGEDRGQIRNVEFVADECGDPPADVLSTEVPLDATEANIRAGSTNLGDLLADSLLWQGQQFADANGTPSPVVALSNSGGIRGDAVTPAGELVDPDFFDTTLPFGNTVVNVDAVSRADFLALLENAVSEQELGPQGQFAQVAGFSFTWDLGNANGNRVVEVTLDDGTVIVQDGAVVDGDPLVVATNSFIAEDRDGYVFPDAQDDTTVDMRDALRGFITSLGGVVTAADYPEGGNARIAFIPPEACDDGIDNDGNGDIDCADADCIDDAACIGALVLCEDPDNALGAIDGPGQYNGTTVGGGDDHDPSCQGNNSEDVYFTLQVDAVSTWCLDTNPTAFDTVLFIREQDCTGGAGDVACDDDSGEGLRSQIEITVRPDRTYFVHVDGFGANAGDFVLNVERGLCVAEICDDGVDNDEDGATDCNDSECAGDDACAGVARAPQPGDLLITEFFPNPAGADTNREWFEVLNVSDSPIQLQGLIVADDDNDNDPIDVEFIVEAGAYVVFGETLDRAANGDVPVDVVFGGTALANTNDEIVLLFDVNGDGNPVEIDRVTYSDAGGWSTANGQSTALSGDAAPDVDNDDPSNWCIQAPSPGADNEDCAPAEVAVQFCRLQFPDTIDGTEGEVVTVYGRLFQAGITDQTAGTDEDPAVMAQLGYIADGADPADDGAWTWTDAIANPDWDAGAAGAGDEDEYQADLTLPAEGLYSYAYRFTVDGGASYQLCDLGGAGENIGADSFDIADAGVMLTAAAPPQACIDGCNDADGCGFLAFAGFANVDECIAACDNGGFTAAQAQCVADALDPPDACNQFDLIICQGP